MGLLFLLFRQSWLLRTTGTKSCATMLPERRIRNNGHGTTRTGRGCVSTEWLTQRTAFQYVSEAKGFSRLAKRAAREAHTPAKGHLKMQGAWYRWRIVVRLFEHKKANCAIDISQELLRQAWAWYPAHCSVNARAL